MTTDSTGLGIMASNNRSRIDTCLAIGNAPDDIQIFGSFNFDCTHVAGAADHTIGPNNWVGGIRVSAAGTSSFSLDP